MNAGLDLQQFHAPFFEEARDNLDRLEQLLVGVDPARVDEETLHAIFRCAHSIKGGAASFGFDAMAALTHRMEALLDRLRRHELPTDAARVDLLLHAADLLRAQLAALQDGGPAPDATAVQDALQASTQALPAAAPAGPARRALELRVAPPHDATALAGLRELFDDIPDLGRIEPLPDADGALRFAVHTTSSDAELIELFAFHLSADQLQLQPLDVEAKAPAAAAPPAAPSPAVPGAPATPPQAADATSLRVAVDKVDRLVNLVGELVITQAMIAQAASGLEPAAQRRMAGAFTDLERHTRHLQESVMAIRMIPMSTVFGRYPRLLRDLATKLGKKFELVTQGGATELDKGLIEKIVDPLTHLVRNGCDHGIEPPAERLARGKPEHGTLTLSASHQGGTVLIEVRDDGRGLSRSALLRKARERGLPAADSLSDDEVWALVFLPGFSTAAQVTEVSGRGVGMDVVKKTIGALGGRVEIESAEGRGTCVRVRLPLTLAIMDSMSVRVGDECYVLPLAAVVESFRAGPEQVRRVAGRTELILLRDELLPVLSLAQLFEVPRADGAEDGSILVLVESEGRRIALRVDDLLGQQQVVVKNLEANFTRIDKLSGATILGDGRVALILDVGALVRQVQPLAGDA